MAKITLDEQIAEVAREVALRRNVYPQFVGRGKMEQAEADLHFARMEAVLATLTWLRENRSAVLNGS